MLRATNIYKTQRPLVTRLQFVAREERAIKSWSFIYFGNSH